MTARGYRTCMYLCIWPRVWLVRTDWDRCWLPSRQQAAGGRSNAGQGRRGLTDAVQLNSGLHEVVDVGRDDLGGRAGRRAGSVVPDVAPAADGPPARSAGRARKKERAADGWGEDAGLAGCRSARRRCAASSGPLRFQRAAPAPLLPPVPCLRRLVRSAALLR